jgi:hypothetical protein
MTEPSTDRSKPWRTCSECNDYPQFMVTEHDKAKMILLARDLAAGTCNDRGTLAQRAQILEFINADRTRHGVQPLVDRAPEEGFYDRAKSLGMARIDR